MYGTGHFAPHYFESVAKLGWRMFLVPVFPATAPKINTPPSHGNPCVLVFSGDVWLRAGDSHGPPAEEPGACSENCLSGIVTDPDCNHAVMITTSQVDFHSIYSVLP